MTTTQELLGGDHPKSFKEFIGQDAAKQQLITAVRSAKKRKVRMPHTLIASGRPGIGKTSLALLCAAEMGVEARVVSGPVTIYDARMLFVEMSDFDMLIIDEAHQLVKGGKANAEWLLHYLQNGDLVTPLGPEKQPAVTIIAATTDAGRLPETLLDRFPIKPRLTGYTDEEAGKIARGMARTVFNDLPTPSSANFREVAAASSGNPRVIRSILEGVRDVYVGHGEANYTGKGYDLSLALEWLGLTHDGLNPSAQAYLVSLLVDFGGQPAGAAAMADRLQEPGGLGYTERVLMDKGYLAKSAAGRYLTRDGLIRARQLVAAL